MALNEFPIIGDGDVHRLIGMVSIDPETTHRIEEFAREGILLSPTFRHLPDGSMRLLSFDLLPQPVELDGG